MKKFTILGMALIMATGWAWGGLKKSEDGFYHFKSGEKFDLHKTTQYGGGQWIGDLHLKSGEIYHSISILDSRKYPFLPYDSNVYGITLNNNIMLSSARPADLNHAIKEPKILFPNGWMVETNTEVTTHLSDGEPKFMFEGDVEFGITAPDTSEKWSAEAKRGREQAKATLGAIFPDKKIFETSANKFSYVETLEWPNSTFYYVKVNLKTSAPLHEWPVTIARTKGLKPGYYGLEKEGLPFGFGSFLHDDGVLTIGNFKDGILEGRKSVV